MDGVGESSKIFKALEIMFSVCYVRIFLEDKRAVLPTLTEPMYLLNFLEFGTLEPGVQSDKVLSTNNF